MKPILTSVILLVVAAGGLMISLEEKLPTGRQHFSGLGDLKGGATYSIATGVSGDGMVVVGYSNTEQGMAGFCWTAADGVEEMDFPQALAISDDGSTTVGYWCERSRVEPVRWSEREGAEALVADPLYRMGAARGVSADGGTIVGDVSIDSSEFGSRDAAFHWTRKSGFKLLDGIQDEGMFSAAYAVSKDGAVVVGSFRHHTGNPQAFRWTAESGVVGLGCLPDHTSSVAFAVSADGSVVVGRSCRFETAEAFRWTRETGMVSLGSLPGPHVDSAAHGVSADGNFVVGRSTGKRGWEAFVWDREQGIRSVHEELIAHGQGDVVAGWRLLSASGISADGAVIVGYGMNPAGQREGWVARAVFGRDTNRTELAKTNETSVRIAAD